MVGSESHAVPQTAAGFLFQLERALYWLATSSAHSSVGVETDDDVAILQPTHLLVMEQDKLSEAETGHPFQDRSRGLWNTLLIWLEARRNGEERHRTAQLHMVTNRHVPDSALVKKLGKNVKSKKELKACVAALREIGKKPSDTMAKLMAAVCAYTDEEISSVVARSRLFDSSTSPHGTGLRDSIVDALHIPADQNADRIVQSLLGWIHEVLSSRWRMKQAGWIDREAFDLQLDGVLRAERAIRKRERAEVLVAVSDGERANARSRPFVERLIEVEADELDIRRAIDCYLRFAAERFRLAAEGDITVGEWDDFFHHLRERWEAISRQCERNRAQRTDVDLGRAVYFETADGGYLAHLAGRRTEHYYFTSGGYHRLADEDQVWWLPTYCPGKGGGPKNGDGQ